MNKYRIDFRHIPWKQSGSNVRMKVHHEGNTQVRLVEFSREFTETGWCQKGHIGYVLKGRLEIFFSRKKVAFKAGDGVFIPPGIKHKHKAHILTDTATLLLIEERPNECLKSTSRKPRHRSK